MFNLYDKFEIRNENIPPISKICATSSTFTIETQADSHPAIFTNFKDTFLEK